MFEIGDKVSYPMHGAGVIMCVEEERILGEDHKYYVLKPCVGDLEIKIPVSNIDKMGIRYIVSENTAREVIDGFDKCACDEDENWNKRYRDNLEKLKSGDLFEVARVTKTLILRDRIKSLSNAERKMLSNAKTILISELVLSTNLSYQKVEELLMSKIS